MEYTIRKCAFTNSREKKNELMKEAFQAAGFTHKDADELMFMFQYHVFEGYGDEIARKKKKMKEVHLQKQKEISNPVKNTRIEAINKEVIQENSVIATASIKTVEVDKQLIIGNEEKYDESMSLEIMNHEIDDDVLEGQYSLFNE